MEAKKRVLTGDRPTGVLHLGHYVGSLQSRLLLESMHQQFIMIADVQALTDHYDAPEILKDNIYNLLACYLAVGLNPEKTTFFIQSQVKELYELTIYFMNLVSINRLSRNPTVKEEIQQKGFTDNLTAGFLTYPISQAADILLFDTDIVPVGNDQLPMIEQTNEIARSFNHLYQNTLFKSVSPYLSSVGRLAGVDGKAKMSKSLKNALFLHYTKEEVIEAVMKMYTDPFHIKVSDPGKVEGNVVFMYLDIFDLNKEELAALKEHYQKGGLGDMILKRRLCDCLEKILFPIREKFYYYIHHKQMLKEIVFSHFTTVDVIAKERIKEIRESLKINYF